MSNDKMYELMLEMHEKMSDIQAEVRGISVGLSAVQENEKSQNSDITWLKKQVNIAKGIVLLLGVLAGFVVKAFIK